MKGLVDSRVAHSDLLICSCFWSMVLWRSLQVMTRRTWRVLCLMEPWLYFLFSSSPTLPAAILMGGCVLLTFHQVTQLELGLCNPTVVEMEPGKEGRKSNVNFKAYSIVFFLTPSFVHLWERIQHFFSVELYLSYFVLLWRDTMISATFRRKNLLGVYSFSRLEAMTIMGSMAAWRQAWCRSRS